MKLLIANILLPLPTVLVLLKYAGWKWCVILISLTVCIGLFSYLIVWVRGIFGKFNVK